MAGWRQERRQPDRCSGVGDVVFVADRGGQFIDRAQFGHEPLLALGLVLVQAVGDRQVRRQVDHAVFVEQTAHEAECCCRGHSFFPFSCF